MHTVMYKFYLSNEKSDIVSWFCLKAMDTQLNKLKPRETNKRF